MLQIRNMMSYIYIVRPIFNIFNEIS